MLAIRRPDGTIAGFIGRARPGTGPGAPKYLNSPETAAYKKGDVLFGPHEARERLARGALPVIVEGPFDAIAVTVADTRYAGIALCGTALSFWLPSLMHVPARLAPTFELLVAGQCILLGAFFSARIGCWPRCSSSTRRKVAT